jgi:hypothetical protein
VSLHPSFDAPAAGGGGGLGSAPGVVARFLKLEIGEQHIHYRSYGGVVQE